MTTSPEPAWTADLLLDPRHTGVYCEQVRLVFREHGEHFRALAVEAHGDLLAQPTEGDNRLQAKIHAWQLARILRQMERHSREVVRLAREFDRTHHRIVVELPRTREEKAKVKALHKANRAVDGGRSAHGLNRVVQNVLAGSKEPTESVPAAGKPLFDLFGED